MTTDYLLGATDTLTAKDVLMADPTAMELYHYYMRLSSERRAQLRDQARALAKQEWIEQGLRAFLEKPTEDGELPLANPSENRAFFRGLKASLTKRPAEILDKSFDEEMEHQLESHRKEAEEPDDETKSDEQ